MEKLFGKIGILENIEIKEMVRIPERVEGHQGDKPRKVLVKFANPKMQRTVLENSKKIRNIGNGWENTYISPDLTKSQREKAYQLRLEKRRRTDNGETNLVIRNGAVVEKDRGTGNGAAGEKITFKRPFTSRWDRPQT